MTTLWKGIVKVKFVQNEEKSVDIFMKKSHLGDLRNIWKAFWRRWKSDCYVSEITLLYRTACMKHKGRVLGYERHSDKQIRQIR